MDTFLDWIFALSGNYGVSVLRLIVLAIGTSGLFLADDSSFST